MPSHPRNKSDQKSYSHVSDESTAALLYLHVQHPDAVSMHRSTEGIFCDSNLMDYFWLASGSQIAIHYYYTEWSLGHSLLYSSLQCSTDKISNNKTAARIERHYNTHSHVTFSHGLGRVSTEKPWTIAGVQLSQVAQPYKNPTKCQSTEGWCITSGQHGLNYTTMTALYTRLRHVKYTVLYRRISVSRITRLDTYQMTRLCCTALAWQEFMPSTLYKIWKIHCRSILPTILTITGHCP